LFTVDALRTSSRHSNRQVSSTFAVVDVKGFLLALSELEQNYLIEVRERVIDQVKLEVFCEDQEVERAVQIIRQFGRTGQKLAGWCTKARSIASGRSTVHRRSRLLLCDAITLWQQGFVG